MNLSAFSSERTGDLLPIKVLGQDELAFVPYPLPPRNWTFPTRLWPLLAEAKESLGTLNGIGRTLEDPNLLLSPLGSREALTSSALEGTYATPHELLLFELSPTKPKSEHDRSNEWLEVSNYRRSLLCGGKLLDQDQLPFCLRLFKELHAKLLGGTKHRYNDPGEFRKHQVAIGSDRRYVPAPPSHINQCLDELEKFINAETPDMDPLVKSYLVHYQFEAIHPFYDGNGRIGRVLLSLMVYKWCKLFCPWLYMSAFFERFKDEYISKMFKISTHGAWDEWIELCLRGTISQAKDAIRRCDALRELRSDMIDRIGTSGTVRSHVIIEKLFIHPVVRVAWLSKSLDVTYPTAKDDVARLMKAGILKPLDDLRPRAYYAPEIFRIAYEIPEDLK